MELNAAALVSAIAALLAGTLAAVVLRTGGARGGNRRLAAVLAGETTFLLTQLILHAAYDGGEGYVPRWLEALTFASLVATSAAYVWLLTLLDTPLVRPFRSRTARIALVVFVVAVGLSVFAFGTFATEVSTGPQLATSIVGMAAIVGVAVFAVVASISAFRRTTPGSTARHRARAFLVAFAARDSIWAIGPVVAIALEEAGRTDLSTLWWAMGPQLTALLYVPLLTYGILKAQLFDIDLKIKIGIRRGTVVGIILIAVFVAAKVVEVYLNRTVGVIAGSVVAGSLLFLVPKLNKLGEKVASTALPKVENTSAYVEFRKLEVYKAAVESALETGELTDKERETLRRLRTKLGISEADATALEGDVRETLLPA